MENNLVWANDTNVGGTSGACSPDLEASLLVMDPEFCDLVGRDYRVSSSSPALAGEEVIGAFADPGCSGSEVLLGFPFVPRLRE